MSHKGVQYSKWLNQSLINCFQIQVCNSLKTNILGLNQFTNKARTDDTTDNHRSGIQDKHPLIWHVFIFICQRKLTKQSCTSLSRLALMLQNILFSLKKNNFKNYFVRSMQNVFFSSKDVILIFEACGIGRDMDTQSMGHSCGPGPWTPSWTRSMDYPCGPPSNFCSTPIPSPSMDVNEKN